MKTVKMILIACLAVCGMQILAADDALFRKMSVDVEMTAAPDVMYRDHSAFSPKNPSTNKWLMLKVKYTPAPHSDFTPVARYRKNSGVQLAFPGWIDDAVLSVQVVFDSGVTVRNLPVQMLFTGKTVFHSIKRDGREHLAVMFIPARLLDRYCSNWGSTAKITKGSFRVRAEMTVRGKVEAVAYANVSGKGDGGKDKVFNNMLKNVPRQLTFENSVLPRSRSPWALLAPDNFDLEVEKSMGSVQE